MKARRKDGSLEGWVDDYDPFYKPIQHIRGVTITYTHKYIHMHILSSTRLWINQYHDHLDITQSITSSFLF